MHIWRLAWSRFNLIASVIGDVQGRGLVMLFYFTILVPFALISRFTNDHLRLRSFHTDQPKWLDRPPTDDNLDSAREQG